MAKEIKTEHGCSNCAFPYVLAATKDWDYINLCTSCYQIWEMGAKSRDAEVERLRYGLVKIKWCHKCLGYDHAQAALSEGEL